MEQRKNKVCQNNWKFTNDNWLTEMIQDSDSSCLSAYEKHGRVFSPLKNRAFPIGMCKEYIKSIKNEEDRKIAMCEYYYFRGQVEKSLEISEQCINSQDPMVRYSAIVMYYFANLSLGHTHLAQYALEIIRRDIGEDGSLCDDPELYALGVYAATITSVPMHTEELDIPPLEEHICFLPKGYKLFAYYVLAHKAYLEGDYERSIGITESAMVIEQKVYPIGMIYLHIMAAVNYMSLKKVEEAMASIGKAWDLAKPDGFIEPFGEHQTLLQGLIEVYFKKNDPLSYKKITDIAARFNNGWGYLHNMINDSQVAMNLTTTEFSVAMLYSKGWTMKAIGEHMGVSDRTIGNYVKRICRKLGVKGKKEIADYMLK